jgi:hypothetical protein
MPLIVWWAWLQGLAESAATAIAESAAPEVAAAAAETVGTAAVAETGAAAVTAAAANPIDKALVDFAAKPVSEGTLGAVEQRLATTGLPGGGGAQPVENGIVESVAADAGPSRSGSLVKANIGTALPTGPKQKAADVLGSFGFGGESPAAASLRNADGGGFRQSAESAAVQQSAAPAAKAVYEGPDLPRYEPDKFDTLASRIPFGDAFTNFRSGYEAGGFRQGAADAGESALAEILDRAANKPPARAPTLQPDSIDQDALVAGRVERIRRLVSGRG